ncbi:MAG: alpha/beta hydrolase [Sedimentisphaerales bacterium]|nr:alpha/beta hydrolase [Sedimentisphaerales bacterium]
MKTGLYGSSNNKFSVIFLGILLISIILFQNRITMGNSASQETFKVTVTQPENGTLTITPALPENGKVAAGTVLTINATPTDGFAIDSCYIAGRTNIEFMTEQTKITVDKNMTLGASFIEKDELKGFTTINNVVYAQPGVKKLKYDVFKPDGAQNLPAIVIVHGGGWSMNCEDVMRGLARELVKSGQYVAFSIDYRWIGNGDGDQTPVTMANIIEDVYGAILHIQDHAKEYGIDPTKIAVTGDSAGGHLSAAAINMVNRIGDGGFGAKEGVYEYKPTYMPAGKSVEQVRKELTEAIKVAAPSYGVFDGGSLRRFVGGNNNEELKAIAPMDNIPNASERAVPQLLLRGTTDNLINNAAVQTYTDALKAAGQTVEYVQVPGASHAFFDWKPDARTKATFKQYGVPYAATMKEFFDKVFYPEK